MGEREVRVGDPVHYVSRGSADGHFEPAHRAAVVTEVEPVCLVVLNPRGIFFDEDVPQDEETQGPGTWHWPEA